MRTGRQNNELRQIKFTKDFTKNALGSVLVEFGDAREKEVKFQAELRKYND